MAQIRSPESVRTKRPVPWRMPPVGARRLSIRPRRHEVVRSAAHEAGKEAGHDVAAVVFERNRRHGHADIGREHADERVDITLPAAGKVPSVPNR
jgi:hypothetical protein